MGSPGEGDNTEPRPWASDERLQDIFSLGTMNKVIKLVQEIATLAEHMPERDKMSKEESIPKMWAAVKDLKPESIKRLQTAQEDMQDVLQGHNQKRQVDADVLALLREWELEDELERLAENGVCKMKDLESMNDMDRKEFGCRLGLRELLQHVAVQKKKKRPSDGSNEHKVHTPGYFASIGKNHKTSWMVKVLDNEPTGNANNAGLADLLLMEYKKQVKWKSTTKVHTDAVPPCEESIKKEIDKLVRTQLLTSKFALKLENFLPETRYEVQYPGHNYEFEPIFHEDFVVNSERIWKTVKQKVKKQEDELVVFVQWGGKFAKFSYVHDETLIALLAERLSITTRNMGERVSRWYEALLG
jgi:hypothetical protein